MARIKSLLGKVSGAVGNFVFRNVKNIGEANILAKRPDDYTPAKDVASVQRRLRFKLAVKLTKAIYSDPDLKALWAKAFPNERTLSLITQRNYPLVQVPDMSGNVYLVPGIGFSLGTTTKQILATQIKVDVDPIGTDNIINLAVESGVQLCAVIFLSQPTDLAMPAYDFIAFKSTVQELVLDAALHFTINLNDTHRQLFDKYNNKTGFYVLLTFDENNQVIHYSNTLNHVVVPNP
jgi:hypothetical protein